jgi:hypothetical protein
MRILGTDFVVTQSAEEANNSVRHPFACFGKTVVFREISVSENIESTTGTNQLPALAEFSQIFRMQASLPDLTGTNHTSFADHFQNGIFGIV